MSGTNINGRGVTVGGEGVDVGETGYEPVGSPSIYYPANEGSGTLLADAIGNEDGDLKSGVGWTTTSSYVGGTAIKSDGTGHVETTQWPGIASDLGTGFSICFTVNTSDTAMFFSSVDASGISLEIMTEDEFSGTTGPMSFVVRDDNSDSSTIETNTDVRDGNDHRLAFTTPDGSPDNGAVYLDGTDDSNLQSSANPNNFTDFNFYVALFARNEDGAISFRGSGVLDAIQVYDYELTSSEVQEDYNRQPWS